MMDDDISLTHAGKPQIVRNQDTARKRAIALLARRDYSGAELKRRLIREGWVESDVALALEAVQNKGFLNTDRFAQGLARRKSTKLGTSRVVALLHGHEIPPQTHAALVEQLKSTEFDRAYAVWQRKFGELPTDIASKAKQLRFLQTRGFSSVAIRQIFSGQQPVDSEANDDLDAMI